MECSLELLERGLLVALQDLGAAGLTSAATEMAAKGGVGIDIDVARVPLREPGMEPFEIMVSESQERMLCVVDAARARRGARGVRALGDGGGRDRRGDRRRPRARARRRAARRRDARSRRSSTNARSTSSTPQRPDAQLYPPPPRVLGLGGSRRGAARAAALAEHRRPTPALRAVRLDRAVAHRAPSRATPTPRCSSCPRATV